MKKIFLFIFMFLMFCADVYASEHLDLVPISGVYSSQLNMSNGSYFSSNQKIYYMNGKVVYCVEPGAPIYTNDYDGLYDLYLSGMSADILNKISLIGYFGYDYPGHQSYRYFLAAQELIWETVGNNEVHFTTGINDTGDIVNIDYEKNEIMSLVSNYLITPSFSGGDFEGVYGEQLVLDDLNGVLSFYDVISSNNSASIDGNSLIINFDSLGSDTIYLKRKKYDGMESVFYSDSSSQDFMFLRASDLFSSISVDSYIPKSRVVIDKKGLMLDDISDQNDFIYEYRGLDGVSFGLYTSQDVYIDDVFYEKDDLVDQLVTVNGSASSILLPNGSYYLKELEVDNEFIIDNSPIDIELNNDKKEVYSYMVDLVNERKKIFISLEKNGEVFDGIVSSSGSYITVPLANIKFGLYSSNDISNVDGRELIKKDVLIKELITDSNGCVNEELDIPFGTYYLKELETLPGYKLDSNIYEFSVSSDSNDNIMIMVTKEPIVNELFKSTLVINKIDSDGNRLGGAGFKLFDSLDNLIYEGVTDSSGSISIDNLGYGKYYFYESSAPDGFISSSRIYEIFVNGDSDLIQVSVLNQRMPVTSDIYAYPKKFSTIGLGFGLLTLSFSVIYEKHKNI